MLGPDGMGALFGLFPRGGQGWGLHGKLSVIHAVDIAGARLAA
jgi:hypothetical protein